jgi:hypothetical protein
MVGIGVGVAGLLAAACGPKPRPAPPPKPPAPKGDLLRLQAKAGDEPKASIKLVVEQEAGAQPAPKKGPAAAHVAFTIVFVEEEKVDQVASDGTAQITARFVDAVGTPGTGYKQDAVDEMALAIDDLKIQFKRSPRGDVNALSFTGLHKPLDENIARAIFNPVYLASRGPLLPEKHVEVGASWDVTTPLSPESKLEGSLLYKYTYKSKEGTVALVLCEGNADAKGAAGGPVQKMTSKSSNELKLDVAGGQLTSNIYDGTTQTEQTAPSGNGMLVVKQHVHVEWIAQTLPASTTTTTTTPPPATTTTPPPPATTK